MASEVASTVISTVTECVMSAIGQEIDYAWNCNDYIGELTSELEKLIHARRRVRRLVTDARKGGEKIEPFVDEWLKSVKEFKDEAEKFLQDKDRAQQKCIGGLCRPWKTRYEMGRRAKEEMLQQVNKLKGEREVFADGVSYREGPKGIGPIKGYEEFESRKPIIADTLKALTDPNVYKIGIYGINGVGKTTLVKEIARQVEEKNFDEVVMATVFPDQNMEEMQGEAIVKKTPNIKSIQDEIADGLDFHFRSKSDRKRADELRDRLKDENRKLIVLDNVWAGLDLKDVGIPSDHEGCKILMISTNEKVLSDEMDSKNNFQLNVLTTKDAEEWFKKMVGDLAKVPDLEEHVTQVAQRCAGLPILLISVARGLKDNGDLDAWKDALKQLSSFDKEEMHAKVDLALQLSYNLLGGDEIKKLFLLCAQLRPDSIFIRDLLIYTMGLGLFKGKNTVKEVHFRLLKLLNDIKSHCFLLESTRQGVLNMHDFVHNFAVSVASRDHVFIAAYDSVLLEWPAEDVLKQCTAISLPYCEIPELPQVLDCPNLESFLLLTKKNRSLKIPEKLFERMRKLKVLDITGVHLLSLPLSFQFLENLQTLCLDACILKDMSLLGKIKTLRVLSFAGSDIIELPKQVKKLTQLQYLYLNDCKRLEVIPPNVLSSLTLLEDLCMENSFLQWEFEGRKSQRKNASLDELKLLPNLKMLDIHITNVEMLPKGSFFEKLERFKIFIGDGWDWYGEYKTSRTLKLKLSTPGKLGKGIKALLKRAEDLYLDELKGIGTSLDELDGQGFPRLKHLHLENSHEIQYIINLVETVGLSAFTSLESLFLDNSENLEKICRGRLLAESFGQLKTLKVGRCGRLKNLFSSSMARGLLQLEEITITDCKIVEEIVSKESDDDADRDEPIKFAQLRALELKLLPQFKRFCSKKKASSISEETGQVLPETDANSKETSSKNDPKTAESVSNKNACFCGLFSSKLKAPFSSATQQNLPASNSALKAIIMENDSLSLFNTKVSFPNMKELKLTSIMIEKIWHDPDIGISSCMPNLTSLVVNSCDNMKSLLSSSMAESLGNLKKLEISNCKLMEEIILTEGLDVEGKSKMKFQKLEFLFLKDLPKLARFCNINLLKCPALKKLQIDNCTKLNTFISNVGVNVNGEGQTVNSALFDEKVAFPNLEILGIFNMSRLKRICHNNLYENSFSKLKSLNVKNVEELQNVFLSHYVLRRFQNLESLELVNCSSLENVFSIQELKDVKPGREMVSSKLRKLYIASLPKLKCIWNNNAGEIHSFQDLHTVRALDCPNVKSIFPHYMARSLGKLTVLSITSCGVEEIISYEEGLQNVAEFEFPQLTLLSLWRLPQLKRFYPGKQTVEFPKLKYLKVYECDNIEIFSSESESVEEEFSEGDQSDGSQQPLMSAEKVIPNLELLTLNSKDVKMIMGGQSTQYLYPNVKNLHLQCFHDDPTAFPFGLIQKFVNLKELVIANSCFTEVFSSENHVGKECQDGSHAKIRSLQLALLYNLKHIKLDHVFGNLETLNVGRCEKLSILAPSSASFENLTVLVVECCNALVNLVTFSTAKSMVQLRKITIKECNLMTDVLASDGEDGKEIVFHKLESVKLISLKSLSSFCSAKWTVKFPSLEEVVVSQCPKMRTFSNGNLEAAKLRAVKTKADGERHWQSDLNATVKHLYAELDGFDGLKHLKLSEFTEIEERWPKQIPGSFFGNLLSLVVDKCASSSIAVPSNLLPSLNVLQDLEIRNCDSVEEVFDNEKPNSDENSGHLSKLVKFHLFDLPKLSKIWNEYSTGILNLKNLKLLKVHNCGNLRNIFTPSVAANLVQLEAMEVKNCHMIEEVIATEEAQKEAAEKIVFPLLNAVTLENLPKLRSFYFGSGSVEFPSLKKINVVACPSAFLSTFLKEEPSIFEEPGNQPLSFPNMMELKLTSIMIEKILHDPDMRISSRIPNLTSLVVDGCDNMKSLLSSSMAESFDNLKKLEIFNCKLMEEIILTEGLDVEGKSKMKFQKLEFLFLKDLPKLARFCNINLLKCPALKKLQIDNCTKLNTFVSNVGVNANGEGQTVNSALFDEKVAFPNLEILEIFNMNGLKRICHNKLYENSFSNLKNLNVKNVEELQNVFPSHYVLRRFQFLESLEVVNCSSLEKVFDIQELKDGKAGREMVSSKLKILHIASLPKLKCIWNNNAGEIHSFQDLHTVRVLFCPNVKSLFPHYMARSLGKLTVLSITSCGVEEIISYEEGLQTVAEFEFPQLTILSLWRLPQLRRFYPGKQTVEFPKLKSLKVYECDNIEIFSSESDCVEEECLEEDQSDGAQQPLMSAEKVIPNLEALSLNSKDVKMISGGQSHQDLYPNVKTLHLQCFHDDPTAFPFGLIQKFVNLKDLVIANSCFAEVFSSENHVGEESQDRSHAKILSLRLALLYNLKHIKLDHVFGNLETLNVGRCEKLSILAPSSASFENLTVLGVEYCNALMNLVTFSTAKSMVQLRKITIKECNLMTEVLADDAEDGKEIVFHKLESLKLISLKSLSSFCSAKWTVKFPSLEEVVVSQCPKMRTFSNGNLEAAKLRAVKTKADGERHWQSDLNATVKHLYAELAGFDGLKQLKLSEFTELDERWPIQFPGGFFGNLLSLVVDKCASSSIAVPSNILPSLKVLQELEIRNCDSVEEVFDNEKPNSDENSGHLSKLVKFHLFDLPKLSKIWNECSTGILNLKNLKLLIVHNCGSLRNIFTLSMAANLVQLEEMEVKSCRMIEEVIATEEAQKEAAEKIVFPLLNAVTLENLPKLRSFYFGSGSVEFPSLKKINVVACPSAFLSTFLKEEPSIFEEHGNQPVAVPSLEKLIVEWSNSMEEVLHGQCRADLLHKLKAFELVRVSQDHTVFPSHFLRRLSSLENLVVSNASIEEIFVHEEKNEDNNLIEILAQLRELKLSKLPNLKFLSKDDLKSSLVFQNLESLEVLECGNLEILVPSSVSFQCLKGLEVSKCHRLITVITSSTAKSLVQLTTMSINECEMLEEIITVNDDEVDNEIIFRKLKSLRLNRLSRLRKFYSGMSALTFPSLEELNVTECPKMEIISQADLKMPKLKKVEVTEGAALQQLLAKTGRFEVQSKRSLTRQPTKGVKNAIPEKSTTVSVPAGHASDIAIDETSTTHSVSTGQASGTAISKNSITLGVSGGQASDIAIAEKSTVSVPAGQASDIAAEGNGTTLIVPGEHVSNNFQVTKHPDSSPPAEDETSIKVKIEGQAASTQSEITHLASTTQDSHATSSLKDTNQNELALHKETHISLQIQKNSQNEHFPNNFTSDSLNQQASTIPVFTSAVAKATLSTDPNSTMTSSSQEFKDITTFRPTSGTPVQLAGSTSRTLADFESLFTRMEYLLKPHQELSSKTSSSSVTHTKFHKSSGASLDDYGYSMDLIKKILKKSLTEVARSADAHKLLINLKKLKNSPNLNSQQVEIIQDYIENFDSLVAYHPFYEQQIDMASALNYSIEEKQRSIANIRASIELLFSDLVAKIGELETDINVLPEAARRQQEAVEKASKANDSWEKLRNSFA